MMEDPLTDLEKGSYANELVILTSGLKAYVKCTACTRGCSKKAGKMQEHTFKPSTIPHASLRRGIVRRFVLRDSAATAKCVRMNECLGVQ